MDRDTQTREIPRDQWTTFFDSLSRRYRGQPVSIEVLGPDIGAQVEAKQVIFEGITMDRKDVREIISLILHRTPQEHLTDIITMPSHVRFERGGQEVLQIESADGVQMLIRFHAAM